MPRLRHFSRAAALTCALGLLPLTACKSLNPTKQYSQVDYAHGGTVSGTVQFQGTPPKPVEIDMAADSVCAMSGTAMTNDLVVDHGGLANVLVYVSSGLGDRTYPITREPVIIDQRGCRFLPHVSAAMVGQAVHFTNSDDTIHNVHMSPNVPGNLGFDVSQNAHADPVTRNFRDPELMIPIRCNTHPWMHSYLSVMANPFFAVTDEQGRFRIPGLPPGTYTVTAVHETLGKRTATITVAANRTAQPAFSYSEAPAGLADATPNPGHAR